MVARRAAKKAGARVETRVEAEEGAAAKVLVGEAPVEAAPSGRARRQTKPSLRVLEAQEH